MQTFFSRRGQRAFAGHRLRTIASVFAGIGAWVCVSAAVLAAPQDAGPSPTADAAATDDEGLVVYADAANLQNGGALGPAIETWNDFLERFPKHPKAPEAAHYLGVCHMQTDPPDPAAAESAFERATKNKEYPLREQSLVNLGWCRYWQYQTASREDPSLDAAGSKDWSKKLDASVSAFEKLLKEFPESRFRDRALYYSGESVYAKEDFDRAISYYDRLLTLPKIAESPFRCDGLYARGVAAQRLERFDVAAASLRQYLSACVDGRQTVDVKLRLGDMALRQKEYSEAAESFASVDLDAASDDDAAYALYRLGFASFYDKKLDRAVDAYERLIERFPDSKLADPARMASAQTAMRLGNREISRTRFTEVIQSDDATAGTEAAHWLAKMALDADEFAEAAEITSPRIKAGPAGAYADDLWMDHGDALSGIEGRGDEAIAAYLRVTDQFPKSDLRADALYAAAYVHFDQRRFESAVELADRFLKSFADHELSIDVRRLMAESRLALDQMPAAADAFAELLDRLPADHPQFARWTLRGAKVLAAAKRFDDVDPILTDRLSKLPDDLRGQANVLLGQSAMQRDAPEKAIDFFTTAATLLDDPRSLADAIYRRGEAQRKAGHVDAAMKSFRQIVDQHPQSPMVHQARYRLATDAVSGERWDDAVRWFDQIIAAEAALSLRPYALFGKAEAASRSGQEKVAVEALDRLLADHPDHSLSARSRLSRGLSLVSLDRGEDAEKDLQAFLDSNPKGNDLGDALFELAMIDRNAGRHAEAAEHLQRLVDEVPDFVDHDEALYALGWAHHAAEQYEAAVEAFSRLRERDVAAERKFEALAMIGESRFQARQYAMALDAFETARANIVSTDQSSRKLKDRQRRRYRELALMHGGQSAAQLDQHDKAIQFYEALRTRFPSTEYLAELFYELGVSHQQMGRDDEALEYFEKVAAKYRNLAAARARFMRGEILFGNREFGPAIEEFQRLMFGFGGDSAAEEIRPWQARGGFEAGRCSELMASSAPTDGGREKAIGLAKRFYDYVVEKHPGHELAEKAKERLSALTSK